jgi:hypothetical protein
MIIAHIVICPYCKLKFDADKEEYIKPNSQRYAHKKCYEEACANQKKEETDRDKVIEYIRQLFGNQNINPRVWKQLKQYTEEYHYTYKGILNALIYAFEVRKNDVSKARGGVGIVPYVYQDANQYFTDIEKSNQKNEEILQQQNTRYKIVEVYIPVPERRPARKRKFNFIDE